MIEKTSYLPLSRRFNSYLPIVIDVETAGVHANTDALLEIAAVPIRMDETGKIYPGETFACHVIPFEGANIDPAALAINKIDPFHPFRFAISEVTALEKLFAMIEKAVQEAHCQRGVLTGHNAHFDLSFLLAAMKRHKIKKSPLHAFTCFDTATLCGLAFGKTILAKAMQCARIPFDKNQAHSAIYDAEKTAQLFCDIVNHYSIMTP